MSLENREILLDIVPGKPSATLAVAPELTRNSNIYEICLAEIKYNTNASTITQANITDTRLDTDLCGIVTGVIKQVDTKELFKQYQAWFEETKEVSEQEFAEWFEQMKGKLSEDAAGNLQLEIDDLDARIAENETGITKNTADIENLQNEKLSKTGGTLTGQLNTQKVAPSASSAYDLGSAGALWRNIYFLNLIWNSNRIYESSGWGVWGATVGLTVRNRDDLNTYMPVTALSFNINSSKRYKENIVDMTEEEANKLDDINIVKFDYKARGNGENQAGVIAEDVYEVLPNVVTMAEIDGKKVPDSVDYSKFVPYLIKKVQMLEKKVTELEGKEE